MVTQRGNMDHRVGMSADRLMHADGSTYPWYVSAGTTGSLDVSVGKGGGANAALTEDFSFSHIVFTMSADQAASPTVNITYRVPGGVNTRTLTYYPGITAGTYTIPVGFLMPTGSTFCTINFAGVAAGTGTLTLQGVN